MKDVYHPVKSTVPACISSYLIKSKACLFGLLRLLEEFRFENKVKFDITSYLLVMMQIFMVGLYGVL